MKQVYVILLYAIFQILSLLGVCQEPNLQNFISTSAEIRTYLSNGHSPFWQQANNYGEIPDYNNANIWAKIALRKEYLADSVPKKRLIQWGGGATLVTSVANNSSLFFSQLYAQMKIWKIDISAGRKYEQVGLIDPILSSGNYSFSTNTLPIPKFQIASLGFIDVPFTKKLLALKFNYADGYLGETTANPFGRFVNIQHTYLHQKSLYGRIGKPHWKFQFFGGFAHQVMWGGEYQVWPTDFQLSQKERYWAIISGGSWLSSRVGNHVANLDIGFSVTSNNYNWTFYRQNIVEDGSLYRGLSNIGDGLNGVEVKVKLRKKNNLKLDKIIVELLHTYNQGGETLDFATGRFGADNYFNHYLYQQGWSYLNRTIGTPFITPMVDTNEHLQQDNENVFTNNNRILLLHFGLQGTCYEKYSFIAKFSFSKNAGTYTIPFYPRANQFSSIIEIKTPTKVLKGGEWFGSLATDIGSLLPNRIGIFVGYRKSGYLVKW